MAWTPPKTWAVGELLTAANFNTHIRDNFNALFLTNWAQATHVGLIQTSVAAWTQLAGVAMNTIGRRVLMMFTASVEMNTGLGGNTGMFRFAVDGGAISVPFESGVRGFRAIQSLSAVATPSAGPHTFQMLWNANIVTSINVFAYHLLAVENV